MKAFKSRGIEILKYTVEHDVDETFIWTITGRPEKKGVENG